MWFMSKDRKVTEALDLIILDCNGIMRELNYHASDEARRAVAVTLLEKTHTINMTLLFGAVDGRSLLQAATNKATFERQRAVAKAERSDHPRADREWATAALLEGYLQVALMSNKQEQKARMNDLLLSWIEVVLGRQEVNRITAKIKSQIISR